MFKLFKITWIFAILLSCAQLRANEIALTFDDAPLEDGEIYSGLERTQKIIDVLNKYKIQSVFFVNTIRFPKNEGMKRIEMYSKAGQYISNHTHSHLRLGDQNSEQFIKSIDQADKILSKLPGFKKWFRFPYLREGSSLKSRDIVRSHLKKMGYINGFVTVDNYDYYLNDQVRKALANKKKVDLNLACKMLLDIMWDGIQYYDEIAKAQIGKVPHVLLMHENDMAAHCLDDLVAFLKAKNWKIIASEQAFENPLLNHEPETLYLHQGRIAAIAHQKTKKEYRSKWESTQALDEEFKRRKILE